MTRRRAWALGAGAALVAAIAVAVPRMERSAATPAIVGASSPGYEPRPAPSFVADTIEIARDGARIRAWVIDPPSTPVGTILLLHGIHSSKETQVPRARHLAARGYRSVLVDLRGHGESSGRWLSYGVRESRDLVALLDALAARDLLASPIGVVGTSYGASTAIQLGAIEPRVRGIVAIAPFASLREVVAAYMQHRLGAVLWILSERRLNDIVDRAARDAGFDADDACPRCAAARAHPPLLLIHGREDERIPWQHSRRIRDAAGDEAELMLVPNAGHNDVGGAPGVEDAIDVFLARTLEAGAIAP